MNKSNLSVVVEADQVIVSMRKAHFALAEAQTIQQTKKILDVAAAAEIYAKRQKLGDEAMDVALSIKVEALRKLGEMLQATPKATGAKGVGKKSAVPEENHTLADLGLTKKESAVAQKLAALPEAQFQQVRDGHVTVAKAIAAVDAAKKPAQPVPSTSKAPEQPAKKAALSIVPQMTVEDEMDKLSCANQELLAENDELTKRLAVIAMDATPDEKRAAADLISELRRQVATLERDLRAVKTSRDGYMIENGELKKQIAYWRKQAEKAAAA